MTQTSTESGTAARAPRGGAAVVFAVGAVVTVTVLPVFLLGGLAVQVRAEFELSIAVLGLASSLFFAVAALVTRVFAGITERAGPTASMRLAAVGSGVCLLGMAAAPSAPWLLLALCVAGLPNALAQPASNELLMARIRLRRRGLAFAVKQSAIPTATLVAGLSVPTLGLTVGWRWAFAAAGVLAFAAACVAPRLSWQRPARGARRRGGSTGVVLVALAAVTGLGSAAANAMGTFVTVSAVDIGFAESTAGLTLALGSAFGLIARLVAGAVADRSRPNLLAMVTVMLGLGSIGYALLAVGHPVTFLIGLMLGFGAGWAWPGVFNYAIAARFPDRVATATSVTQTGVYAGAAAGPLLFGLVAEHVGTSAAWLTAGAMVLAATTTLIVVRRVIAARAVTTGSG